jgi:hypothetical protein
MAPGKNDEGLAASAAAARASEAEFLRTWGPLPPFNACPIGWHPSSLAPVFYGYRVCSSKPVSELAELAAPVASGAETSPSRPLDGPQHALHVRELEQWGGWGANPRPADYESAALTG